MTTTYLVFTSNTIFMSQWLISHWKQDTLHKLIFNRIFNLQLYQHLFLVKRIQPISVNIWSKTGCYHMHSLSSFLFFHFHFFLFLHIYLLSASDYSSKPVVTLQTQLSAEVLLIIWKGSGKKKKNVVIHLDSTHYLKKSMGLYAYSVIEGLKSRLRYNKSLLKCLLSSYWNTHSDMENWGAGSNRRRRKDSNTKWE